MPYVNLNGEVIVNGNIDQARVAFNYIERSWDSEPNPWRKVFFSQQYPTGTNLIIDIRVLGNNGDSYQIQYSCLANNVPLGDPTKPSPITGIITENGRKDIRIKILVI